VQVTSVVLVQLLGEAAFSQIPVIIVASVTALANRLVGILHGCLKPTPPTTNTQPGPTPSKPPLDT
jgi:hypothetical protein